MGQTVNQIMTRLVVRVNADDPLRVIQHKLHQGGFHHVPVMDGTELIGIVSDRDVLKAISPFLDSMSEQGRDLRTLDRKAHQIMTPQPYTILPDASLEAAAEMLLALDISALPVVRLDGHLEGIVTWRDILGAWSSAPPKAG